jgi:anti-sigma factor RsiW
MGCRRMKKIISLYIDGELSATDRESFLLHIGKCERCCGELIEARAVHRLFAEAGRSQAPYGFTARVMANLEQKELPGKRIRDLFVFRPFLPRVAGVAFALSVMAFGIVAGNRLILDNAVLQEQAGIEQAFSLDVFQATPPDSIGGVYESIVGARNEG